MRNGNGAVSKEEVKNKGIARNKGVHDVAEESVEPRFAQEIGWESPRAGSARKLTYLRSGCAACLTGCLQ
ncbi:hypothetical protein V6N13_045324 [Hibiscus sabdariffa]